MLTIGEFSGASRLTIKALRMYHDEGVIVPEKIDPVTGYRYYGDISWRRAQAVKLLGELGFSHRELKEILAECDDDDNLGEFLRKRLGAVNDELARKREIRDRIIVFLETDKGTYMKQDREIQEKVLAEIIVCGIRHKGRYDEMGKYFGPLFKKAGRYIAGPALGFYFDSDFHENDADIEAAIMVRKEVRIDGIDCHVVPQTRVFSITHYGSYETIGDSYKRIFDAIESRGLKTLLPSREIYYKGPGMFFPRDPKRFVTEIQIPVE